MIPLLIKLVVSAFVGAIVWAVCLLVGPLLASTGAPFVTDVGKWITDFALLFGLGAAIWFFVFGKVPTLPVGP